MPDLADAAPVTSGTADQYVQTARDTDAFAAFHDHFVQTHDYTLSPHAVTRLTYTDDTIYHLVTFDLEPPAATTADDTPTDTTLTRAATAEPDSDSAAESESTSETDTQPTTDADADANTTRPSNTPPAPDAELCITLADQTVVTATASIVRYHRDGTVATREAYHLTDDGTVARTDAQYDPDGN